MQPRPVEGTLARGACVSKVALSPTPGAFEAPREAVDDRPLDWGRRLQVFQRDEPPRAAPGHTEEADERDAEGDRQIAKPISAMLA